MTPAAERLLVMAKIVGFTIELDHEKNCGWVIGPNGISTYRGPLDYAPTAVIDMLYQHDLATYEFLKPFAQKVVREDPRLKSMCWPRAKAAARRWRAAA